MKLRFLLVIAGLALLLVGCKTTASEGLTVAPQMGAVAPDFRLENVHNESVALSDHRGKVVLVNFWATWCPPCRAEMPGIQAAYEKHSPNFAVLAVDDDEDPQLVSDFQWEFNLTFDVLLDPRGQVQNLYRVRSYPTSMFVDEFGVIRIVHIGLMTEGQLDQYLTQMGVIETAANQ